MLEEKKLKKYGIFRKLKKQGKNATKDVEKDILTFLLNVTKVKRYENKKIMQTRK